MLSAGESHFSANQVSAAELGESGRPIAEWCVLSVAAVSGGFLALSAPGLEQWYLSWFAFSGLLLLTVSAKEPWQASLRGLAFGFTYNLVYCSWFLTFRPVFCQGTFVFFPAVITVAFWLLVSYAEGLFIGISACLIRAVPLTGGWLPQKHQGRWYLPSFVVVPILWILVDRLCNTTQMLGFPWASLQYGQYKQLIVLQAASVIGGVGIAAWIVLVNLNLAIFFARLRGLRRFLGLASSPVGLNALAFPSRRALLANTAVTVVLSLVLLAFGQYRLNLEQARYAAKSKVKIAAIQAGFSDAAHQVPASLVFEKYFELVATLPAGSICVWPEWALPLDFSRDKNLLAIVSKCAADSRQSWVLGCFDKDTFGRRFNFVCAIAQDGAVLPQPYHKRYLVPVGEFTPDWIRYSPVGTLLYGPNKDYGDTSSGEEARVFDLKGGRVAPLVCFECAYPRVCAHSVLAGGQLLADSSDNSWFGRSILSDQMVAFCVMRAAENHRSFVFATALGPSAIIDSSGHILRIGPRDQAAAISCEVPVEQDITPFTHWCF